MNRPKIFFTIIILQAGAIEWYVDRIEYSIKRLIFIQKSMYGFNESPCTSESFLIMVNKPSSINQNINFLIIKAKIFSSINEAHEL